MGELNELFAQIHVEMCLSHNNQFTGQAQNERTIQRAKHCIACDRESNFTTHNERNDIILRKRVEKRGKSGAHMDKLPFQLIDQNQNYYCYNSLIEHHECVVQDCICRLFAQHQSRHQFELHCTVAAVARFNSQCNYRCRCRISIELYTEFCVLSMCIGQFKSLSSH